MVDVNATVTAPFDANAVDGTAGLRLQMELDPGFTPAGVFNVRLYPGVNAKVVTNVGSVAKIGVNPLTIEREVVQFSGGDSANMTYPITTLVGTSTFGSIFDIEGNLISVSFSQDGYQLKASKPCYGAVEVEYVTTYNLLEYNAEVTPLVPVGVSIRYGTILAFYEGNVATFDIPIPELEEGDYQECYRIVSDAVVNELGAWEKPEGWTGTTGSPTWPDGDPDPDEPSILVERPHEIGYVTSQGSTFMRTFFVRLENPKTTEPTFEPELRVVQSTGGGPYDDQLASPRVQQFIADAIARVG